VEPLNLGLLLFIPSRFMESAVLARLKEHGHDIALGQARVFQRIGPDGSRLGKLAQAAQVSKQTPSARSSTSSNARATSLVCPTRRTPAPDWSWWPTAAASWWN